ncbi:MAG: hypothetical protein CMF41_00270 [Legionellales bacterium]|nr:hypothetical protein [Legionellales bacterium]OUX66476.1 MAG: hypothetical protein CBE41_00190 [Gammaproteobacteria bacterium TMED281]
MRKFHVEYSSNLLGIFKNGPAKLCFDGIVIQLDTDSPLPGDFLNKINGLAIEKGIEVMLPYFSQHEKPLMDTFLDELEDKDFLEYIVPKFDSMMSYYGHGLQSYLKLAKYLNRGLKLIDAEDGDYEEKATRMFEIYHKLKMLSDSPVNDDDHSVSSWESLAAYEENQIEFAVLLGPESIKLLFKLFLNDVKRKETFNLIEQIDLEHSHVLSTIKNMHKQDISYLIAATLQHKDYEPYTTEQAFQFKLSFLRALTYNLKYEDSIMQSLTDQPIESITEMLSACHLKNIDPELGSFDLFLQQNLDYIHLFFLGEELGSIQKKWNQLTYDQKLSIFDTNMTAYPYSLRSENNLTENYSIAAELMIDDLQVRYLMMSLIWATYVVLIFALCQMFPIFSNVWLQVGFNLISTLYVGNDLYSQWVRPLSDRIEALRADYAPSPFECFNPENKNDDYYEDIPNNTI